MAGFENSSIPDWNPHLNITSLDTLQIFRTCVMCFSVLFGPPTHTFVLWFIVTRKGIASEFLNFNLSICEIIISVNCFLMLLALRFTEVNACFSFTMGFTITARPLFQCLMCVERYLAVVRPVTFLKYKPLRYRLICCANAWLTTLGSCSFSMFTSAAHVCVYRAGILLQFVLFFSANLFCCLSVLLTLKKPGPGERAKERVEENQMKRRAFQIILMSTVTMVIMYVPVIISSLLYFVLLQDDLIIESISLLCFVLAGFVQPLLYLHQAGKLPFLCCCQLS